MKKSQNGGSDFKDITVCDILEISKKKGTGCSYNLSPFLCLKEGSGGLAGERVERRLPNPEDQQARGKNDEQDARAKIGFDRSFRALFKIHDADDRQIVKERHGHGQRAQ